MCVCVRAFVCVCVCVVCACEHEGSRVGAKATLYTYKRDPQTL